MSKPKNVRDRSGIFDDENEGAQEENSLLKATQQIFHKDSPTADLTGGRVVAKPTLLSEIWADVKQPRRAIPASIRGDWDGSPDKVQRLLTFWGKVALSKADFDPKDIVNGKGDGVEVEGLHPLAGQYVELCRLAQDIKRGGLINPISVIKEGSRFLIESGERRYLAYHLLKIIDLDERWDKIPAITSTGENFVWRQATENTARRALNAIGMARQLALLIMESRRGVDGQTYDDYASLVVPGGCDRAYYAQVANGNIHRIPKGYAERIQSAMGLSDKQLSRYRALLRLTDDEKVNDILWQSADVEDWAEGALRMIADSSPIGEVRAVLKREGWTLEDLRGLVEKKPVSVPTAPPPSVKRVSVKPIETQWSDGDWVCVAYAQSQFDANFNAVMNEVKDMEVCTFIEAFMLLDDEGRGKGGALARVWRHTQKDKGVDEYAVVSLARVKPFGVAQENPLTPLPPLPQGARGQEPEDFRGASIRKVSVVDEDEPSALPPRISPPDSPAHPTVNRHTESDLSEVDNRPAPPIKGLYKGGAIPEEFLKNMRANIPAIEDGGADWQLLETFRVMMTDVSTKQKIQRVLSLKRGGMARSDVQALLGEVYSRIEGEIQNLFQRIEDEASHD